MRVTRAYRNRKTREKEKRRKEEARDRGIGRRGREKDMGRRGKEKRSKVWRTSGDMGVWIGGHGEMWLCME